MCPCYLTQYAWSTVKNYRKIKITTFTHTEVTAPTDVMSRKTLPYIPPTSWKRFGIKNHIQSCPNNTDDLKFFWTCNFFNTLAPCWYWSFFYRIENRHGENAQCIQRPMYFCSANTDGYVNKTSTSQSDISFPVFFCFFLQWTSAKTGKSWKALVMTFFLWVHSLPFNCPVKNPFHLLWGIVWTPVKRGHSSPSATSMHLTPPVCLGRDMC